MQCLTLHSITLSNLPIFNIHRRNTKLTETVSVWISGRLIMALSKATEKIEEASRGGGVKGGGGGGGGGAERRTVDGWMGVECGAVKIDHRSYNNDRITLAVDPRTRPKNGLVKSGGSVDKMIDGHRFWLG
ncbi:hypothetical protein T06_10474 [Trichinella sp. T6]|nr:hypothetical protein T06_10474 [Trichinella sp. T6]